MPVKLEVIAKLRSLLRSGIKTTRACACFAAYPASAPSASQVRMRCAQSLMMASANRTAATLSGLLPERPNDTSKVGVAGDR